MTSAPLTVTRSPLYGLNVIGAPLLPERAGLTVSRYTPPRTSTVSPAPATLAARWIVRKGEDCVPALLSDPPVDTKYVESSTRASSGSGWCCCCRDDAVVVAELAPLDDRMREP